MHNKIFNLTMAMAFISLVTIAQQRIAPSYPLITHNPSFSIWSNSDTLTSSTTRHWTGKEHPLVGHIEVDGVSYRFLGAEPTEYETVLPTGEEKDVSLQYTEDIPSENWQKPTFDASKWKSGLAPFGDNPSAVKTKWESDNIWLRRQFEIHDLKTLGDLYLKINHDDDIVVYLNGTQIFKKEGWTNEFDYIPLDKSAQSLLKKGHNTIAIHLKNTAGGRYLDFGLVRKIDQKRVTQIAQQKSVEITPTRTIYEFDCGKVGLKLTFTSPLLLKDLNMVGRPISYIDYEVISKDKKDHSAVVTISASTDIAVNKTNQEVVAAAFTDNNISYLKAGTTQQNILSKGADDIRIEWGYFYVAAPSQKDYKQTISSHAGESSTRGNNPLKELKGHALWLNTTQKLTATSTSSGKGMVALGYDEIKSIQYFGTDLNPWWNKDGNKRIENEFEGAINDFKTIKAQCVDFDNKLTQQLLKSGGKEYAHLCVIAYRQSIAAHSLVQGPDKEILWLSKENNSGGFINTVDVTYPSAPLYLMFNNELMKGMLNGIFYFSESGKYPHPWAAHDLGTYPHANGQTYGEPMPVEESGNMTILTAAVARADGNAAYAEKHWDILTTWTDYLVQEGLDPKEQLCTDDFAGHLARNANLSLKAIVGIACYADLAKQLGKEETYQKYRKIAESMVPKWMELADAGDHYALTFDDKNTWSQKYNLVWDKVLGLNLFPQELYDKEINYYMTKGNKFGIPLDSRKSYTKNDWILWTATFAPTKEQFDKLVHPVYIHALETPSRVPLNDFYDSNTGIRENFKARSVVGGFYMKAFDDFLKEGKK